MSAINQRWMAWSGVLSIVILLLGMWVIAGFVPPPGPNLSMDEIVRIYVDHNARIKIGMIVACAGVTLLAPWTVAIAIQMRRIEGELAPLALCQALLGLLLLVEFYIPCVMWQAAAFRPEVDPGFTYRIHDLASIMFIALPWTGMLQAILLAIAIFQDRHESPVFPRWLAYASLWSALCFLPGGFNCLATTGVIAWSGLISWWLALAIFGGWILMVSICLVKYAIPHQVSTETDPPSIRNEAELDLDAAGRPLRRVRATRPLRRGRP